MSSAAPLLRGLAVLVLTRLIELREIDSRMAFLCGRYRPEESGMEYATDEDGQIATMFPATNFIRLVMVHWEDEAADGGKGGGKSDCRCPTCKDTGYLKPACITQ